MSDTSNLANNGNEPSMEDILSSIRKVIAQETVENEAVENETFKTVAADSLDVTPLATDNLEIDIQDTSPDTIIELDEVFEPTQSEAASQDTSDDIHDLLELEIIADELPEHTAPPADTIESIETSSEAEPEDIFELTALDEDLTIDDILTEDTPEMEAIILDTPDISSATDTAPQGISFDENLDLVMDTDASDYVTTSLAAAGTSVAKSGVAKSGKATSTIDIEDWRAKARNVQAIDTPDMPDMRDDPITDLLTDDLLADDLMDDLAIPEPDALETLSVPEDILSEEIGSEDIDSEVFAPADKLETLQESLEEDYSETTSPDVITEDIDINVLDDIIFEGDTDIQEESLLEEESELEEIVDLDTNIEATPVTPDEDMDLVKSLLADLMDEPSSKIEVPAEDLRIIAPSEAMDNGELTDDFSGADIADNALEAADTSLDTTTLTDLEPESAQPESDLAQLAREVTEREVQTALAGETLNADDIVELPTPNLVSKLALVSGATIGATAAAGAVVTATKTSKAPQNIEVEADISEKLEQLLPPEGVSEETPEEPSEAISDNQPTNQDPTSNGDASIEEEKPMAKLAKTDALSDIETSKEAGIAFASLTNAVHEKNLKDENGPAIGELVKEALKPMLQEWLDKNLKAMVQRSVTAEIKRISSGK